MSKRTWGFVIWLTIISVLVEQFEFFADIFGGPVLSMSNCSCGFRGGFSVSGSKWLQNGSVFPDFFCFLQVSTARCSNLWGWKQNRSRGFCTATMQVKVVITKDR